MKRISGVILTVLLTALMTMQISAAKAFSDVVTVHAAYGTPKINGSIDSGEWDQAAPVNVSLNGDPVISAGNGVYQGEWESTRKDSDYSGTFKVMWDDSYLYILEIRKDDVVNLSGNANKPYNTDGVLVFIMASDIGSDINPSGYAHHIFYTVGNEGKIGGNMKMRIATDKTKTTETVDVNGGKISSALTSNGYIVELAFPWSAIQQKISGFKPGAKSALGFSLVIHDSDGTTPAYQKQLCWAKIAAVTPANGYDYGGWGTLILDQQAVAEQTKAAAQNTAVKASTSAQTSSPQTGETDSIIFVITSAFSLAAIVLIKKNRAGGR